MPKAIRIAALLLLALAILLVVIAVSLGRRVSETSSDAGAITKASDVSYSVIAARIPIRAGSNINTTDLTTTALANPRSDSFVNQNELGNATAARDIEAGEVITRTMLLQGISSQVRPGERAIAVSVDELIGVGNRVTPGDFVDVFMSLKDPDSQGAFRQENAQARLLLSRLRVLSYGSRDLTQAVTAASGEGNPSALAEEKGSRAEAITARTGTDGGSNGATEATARTAVLAVPVEQTGRLLLGAHSGKLFLALRNPGDVAVADASAFSAPDPVLALRRDLDPAARATAATPENEAFAGIDLLALAGKRPTTAGPIQPAPSVRRATRATSSPSNGVEIIRGSAPVTRLSSP